jgi:hypothetical protein
LKEKIMAWIRDGEFITANYLGVTVAGIVMDSRVKYGGKVQYTVVLSKPVQFPWRSEPSTTVLIDHDEILETV